MSERYSIPPVREAIFDVRFKKTLDIEESVFEELKKSNNEKYPTDTKLMEGEFSLEIKEGSEANFSSTSKENGIKLVSSDGTEIVQLKRNGFTFSKLKPYEDWDAFYTEAKRMFDIYMGQLEGVVIGRVALRYINAIDVPQSNFRLEDYLKTTPTLSDDIPQGLIGFFMRTVIQDDDSRSISIINQTIEDNKKENITTLLLDIDSFQNNLNIKDDEDLNKVVQELKKLRTVIFEGSLTAKTKELFN